MPGRKGTPRIVFWGCMATDKDFRKLAYENVDKAFKKYDFLKVKASDDDLEYKKKEITETLQRGGDKLRTALAEVERIVCSLDGLEQTCEEVPEKPVKDAPEKPVKKDKP